MLFAALLLLTLSAGCARDLFSRTDTSTDGRPKAFSFGLVADVQYADKPTNGNRRYREAVGKLNKAVTAFNQSRPDFVLQLGDLIDANGDRTRTDFDRVMAAFARLEPTLYHAVGNHCLDAGRAAYDERVGLERYYYDFGHKGWRFIVLDGNDISTRDLPEDGAPHRRARAFIDADPHHNKPWNGALGKAQKAWLKKTLDAANRRREPIIVAAHFPVLPAASHRQIVLWDYQEVLDLLEATPGVVAYLAGHHHEGGYAQRAGIHHITFPAMCDAPTAGNAYAFIDLRPGELHVRGVGTVPHRSLKLNEGKASPK